MLKYMLIVLVFAGCSDVNPRAGIGLLEYESTHHGDSRMNREFYEAEKEYFFFKWSFKF